VNPLHCKHTDCHILEVPSIFILDQVRLFKGVSCEGDEKLNDGLVYEAEHELKGVSERVEWVIRLSHRGNERLCHSLDTI